MLTPDPWEGMTDEHWAALAAIFPLPDPVGGHGDVLADLGATPGPIGAAFRARRLLGLERYGVPLRYGDGRPPGVDSFQELLDLSAYEKRDGFGVDHVAIAQLIGGEPSEESQIDRAALADAFWNLDTVQAAGLRAMVDAAVTGVDMSGGRAEERGASPSERMVDLEAPCPFCGSEVGIVDAISPGNGGDLQWFVLCQSCGCEGPWTKSEAGALAAWSRRPSGGRA